MCHLLPRLPLLPFVPRLTLVRVALTGATLLALSACNRERDPAGIKVDRAYALSITSDYLGDQVPDRFRVYVDASEVGVQKVRPGDSFRLAFNVGTRTEFSKYGGISGLRFTIGRVAFSKQFNFTAYWAESEPVEISCDAQNKLRFTISGESVDDIQMRVKSAGMPDHMLVRQNGHPFPGSHGHNPAGSDYTYRYNCLLERQP